MHTAIIIPNWNGQAFLRQCLDSLLEQTHSADIVVVDNGSSDDSLQLLSEYPRVRVIALEQNCGFAGGVNTGIEHATNLGAEYIALFNNDAVASPRWLEQLMETMDASADIGIVTGKLLDWDGDTIDSTGDQYSIWGTPFPRGRGDPDSGQYQSREEVCAASGGASLYRVELFRDIGPFDEWLFAYYEDVDISLRARLAGWRIVYDPRALAYHHIGGTSHKLGDFRLYHMYKNFWVVFLKNMPGWYVWRYGWRVAGVFAFKMAQLMKRLKLLLLGKILLRSTLHLPKVLLQRLLIHTNRRISPAHLDAWLYHAPPPTQPGLIKIARKLGIR